MDAENTGFKINVSTNHNLTITSTNCVLNSEPCVNISRLKSFYCQNFTAILNNPEVVLN